MLGRLLAAWQARRSRRPVSVELDVTDQLVLQYLLRFSGRTARTAREVHREVNMRRPVVTYELVAYSLQRLEGGGLVQRTPAAEGASDEAEGRAPTYRATPLGRRLDGRLPEAPRSNVEFYL